MPVVRASVILFLILLNAGNPAEALRGQQAVRAQLIATIRAGQRPEPVLADKRNGRVFIGYEHSGTVAIVDARTNRVIRSIPTGKEVEQLAFDDSRALLYSANRTSDTVSVIDVKRLRRRANIAIPGGPNGLALDTTGRRLFVSLGKGRSVAVLDTSSNRVVRTVPMPAGPEAIGVDENLGRIFVGFPKLNEVVAYSEKTFGRLGRIRVGRHPVHPMLVNVQTHRVYLVNSGSSTVSIINSRTMRLARTLPSGPYPEGIDLDQSARRLFVSNEGDPGTDKNSGHTVSVIDLHTGRVVATIQTVLGPDGVAYEPGVACLYVGGEDRGAVQVFRLQS